MKLGWFASLNVTFCIVTHLVLCRSVKSPAYMAKGRLGRVSHLNMKIKQYSPLWPLSSPPWPCDTWRVVPGYGTACQIGRCARVHCVFVRGHDTPCLRSHHDNISKFYLPRAVQYSASSIVLISHRNSETSKLYNSHMTSAFLYTTICDLIWKA